MLELEDVAGTVTGDAGQLSQVVMNLITNAAESLDGQPGRIVISTSTASAEDLAQPRASGLDPEASYVLVRVEDTGAGMDEDTRARMFEPFFTTKFTGRGLGLAAVAGIVRSHDGLIDVTTTVGRGTTFSVFLPITRPVIQQPANEAVPALQGRGQTILVVDDESADLSARLLHAV